MKKIILNGAITVNCYIINKNNKYFIIDPGSDINNIIANVPSYNPEFILLTHGHFDHIDEIGYFNCPIYIHKNDYILLENKILAGYGLANLEPKYDLSKLDIKFINNNDIIKFEGNDILVIHTPGHTVGSVCYLYEDKLFSGDTLFHLGIGRTDLPNSNNKLMKTSIVNLINNLNDNIKVYPGHDINTTIKNERKNNRFYINFKNRS